MRWIETRWDKNAREWYVRQGEVIQSARFYWNRRFDRYGRKI
jgi:hypothetical protein